MLALRLLSRWPRGPRQQIPLLRQLHHKPIVTAQVGGPVGAAAHRMYFSRQDTALSPWHDIPLAAAEGTTREYNMVCEIPRWSNAKLEMDTSAPFNPIRQDIKKGRLRYVANVFPYKGYIWNYGALPQTYEDPHVVDEDTGYVGDGDPIDVLELGQAICPEGSVHRVKILGVLALVDDAETDWKVLAIRSDDPMAPMLDDIADLDRHMPGLVTATVDWFTKYKVPDGKPRNGWAFDGSPKDAAYAHQVIAKAHASWQKLLREPQSKLALTNSSNSDSPHYQSPSDARETLRALTSGGSVTPIDPVDQQNTKWSFVANENTAAAQ
ncbi:Inorganic pyrophosphatase [Coemansia sp. RSA 552]|nr:Inorganic pyrophosphatase [Coemansia sp. RSA 552]